MRPSVSSHGYNVRVDTGRNSPAQRFETLGLLLIVLAILIIVLVRWGGYLPWSAR